MSDYKYDLTVISISYNNFERVKEHVESIIVQDFDNYELIFQDDGTQEYDENRIKCLMSSDYLERHNVQFFHNERNVGTVQNLNRGYSHANGKIVMPIAMDDYLANEHVFSLFMKEFKNESCNVCTCSVIQEKSKTIFPRKRDIDITRNGTTRELLDRLYASNCISGALMTTRKDFFIKENLFDTRFRLIEDYPTWLKIVKEGERIRVIEDVCLVHGESGVSNRFQTLFNRNKIATRDAKLIKDIFVMPNITDVKNKLVRRYIVACYYVRYHKNKIQFFIKLLQYIDVWVWVTLYYILHFKDKDGIYYYLKKKGKND